MSLSGKKSLPDKIEARNYSLELMREKLQITGPRGCGENATCCKAYAVPIRELRNRV